MVAKVPPFAILAILTLLTIGIGVVFGLMVAGKLPAKPDLSTDHLPAVDDPVGTFAKPPDCKNPNCDNLDKEPDCCTPGVGGCPQTATACK
jgi:hypothetical protein